MITVPYCVGTVHRLDLVTHPLARIRRVFAAVRFGPMAAPPTASSTTALAALSDGLRSAGLELDIEHASKARAIRDELAHQIDDYLIPRLDRLDALQQLIEQEQRAVAVSALVGIRSSFAIPPTRR